MTVYHTRDSQGRTWVLDPAVIYAINRAAVRTRIMRNRSRIVTYDNGFMMPTTWTFETNWSGSRAEIETESNRYWAEAVDRMRRDPRSLAGSLVGLVNDAITDDAWYRSQRTDAQRRSMQNIDRNVSNWEAALTGLRIVRDGSATVLVVAGSIAAAPVAAGAVGVAGISGAGMGTGVATLGVGSVLRGAFTYQDTGNVGSAVINATGTFTVGLIGIGTPVAASEVSAIGRGTVVLIGAAGAGGTSGLQTLAEGGTMRQAVVSAVGGMGAQLLGGAIGARMDGLGFFTQVMTGAAVDMATGRATAAITEMAGGSNPPPPPTSGNIDFLGLPTDQAEVFVRNYAMRQL